MNEFIQAMGPIFLFWSVPLIPLIVTSVITVVESVRESPRRLWSVRSALTFRSMGSVKAGSTNR